MAILTLLPVAVSVVLLVLKPLLENQDIEIADLFSRFSFTLYLHLLLPLLSVFFGTAIIADEVDERTLPYLLTRPVSRWRIVLSKTLSSIFIISALLIVSLFFTYSLLLLSRSGDGWLSGLTELLQCMGVLVLGGCVYTTFFGLLSGFLKRPVLIGLLFTFGWENMAAFFPGNIKLITVVHYLHRLYPHQSNTNDGSLQNLIMQNFASVKELSPAVSLIILILMFLLFLISVASVLHLKEFRLSQE